MINVILLMAISPLFFSFSLSLSLSLILLSLPFSLSFHSPSPSPSPFPSPSPYSPLFDMIMNGTMTALKRVMHRWIIQQIPIRVLQISVRKKYLSPINNRLRIFRIPIELPPSLKVHKIPQEEFRTVLKTSPNESYEPLQNYDSTALRSKESSKNLSEYKNLRIIF